MTFKNIFDIYYTLFRGEDSPPDTSDPEWVIAIRLYNNALIRMASMDDTKWNFMWTTLQSSSQVSPALVRTVATSDTTYTAPTNMAEPGGVLTLIDSNSNRLNYSVVAPHEAQAMSATSTYGYFTGSQEAGYVLNLNPSPTASINGYGIDYNYYRKPTPLIASTDDGVVETGTTVIEGGDPAFYYNHMLAQRFRNSENYPAYQTALRDAEEALKGMKLKNNSGSYYNSWTIQDTSGSGWGL